MRFFQLVSLTFLLVFLLFQGGGCGTLLCEGCKGLNGVVVVVVRVVVTVAERILVTVSVSL